MIYTCERCGKAFEREKKRGGYLFCSQKCANCHVLKLGREELLVYAELGALNQYIAKRLGVSRCTIRRALVKHDLYRLWSSRRYKKCVSPKAGQKLETRAVLTFTASAEAISLSAASAPQMAGDTSCGG